MSNIPDNLLYSKEDEWIAVDGDVATIGITDYAQDSLSDIVFLELPDTGDSFEKDAVFGVVESVKAAADLYMPITCEIVEMNEDLLDTPEIINEEPYESAWMVKVKITDPSQLDTLMDAKAYTAYCEERG